MPETGAESKFVGGSGSHPAPSIATSHKATSSPNVLKGVEPAVWRGKGEVATGALNDVLKKASTTRKQSMSSMGRSPVKRANESVKSLATEAPEALLGSFDVPPSLAVAKRVNGRSFFEVEVIPSFI